MSIDEEKAGRYLDEIRALHADNDRLEQRLKDRDAEIARLKRVLERISAAVNAEHKEHADDPTAIAPLVRWMKPGLDNALAPKEQPRPLPPIGR